MLSVPLSADERRVVEGLVHTNGILFSLGYLRIVREGESERFAWRAMSSAALLQALEGCSSFKLEGSGAQTLYGKVLRIHSHHVN
jgi:hypothetical protein